MENTTAITRLQRLWIPCLLFASLLNLGCGTDTLPPTTTSARDDAPDQEAWNSTIYLLENDRHRLVVSAVHRMHFMTEQRTILDQGLRIEFYDEDGRLASTLTADRGTINEQSHDMAVFGHVMIVSPEHGTLETDSLRWIEMDNLILTDAPVRISTEKDVITGKGFRADPELEHWEILRNVRGRFNRGDELSNRFDKPESQE